MLIHKISKVWKLNLHNDFERRHCKQRRMGAVGVVALMTVLEIFFQGLVIVIIYSINMDC